MLYGGVRCAVLGFFCLEEEKHATRWVVERSGVNKKNEGQKGRLVREYAFPPSSRVFAFLSPLLNSVRRLLLLFSPSTKKKPRRCVLVLFCAPRRFCLQRFTEEKGFTAEHKRG